jgi:arylamine N-acetyltransferase
MTGDGRTAKSIFTEHFRIPEGDPDLDMLKVVVSHFSGIPYENITKIIKKFTADDTAERLRRPEEVISGYVDSHTGGTCFSLTWCLGSILSKSGFDCYPVMADMRRPNIHCALIVMQNSRKYLIDPGYLIGEPVLLDGRPVTVQTSFGEVELRPRGTVSYDLFTIAGNERKWRYRVRTTPVSSGLFFKYWQDSFSLPMMNSIQLTRLTGRGHLYIRNHHLRLRRGDGKINENIRQQMESRIETEFGIPAEVTAEAREHLERMKAQWRTRKRAGRGKAHR